MNSPVPETADVPTGSTETAEQDEHAEHEAEAAGGFREPHSEVPAEFASHETEPVEAPAVEPTAKLPAAPEPVRAPEPPRELQRDRWPERRSEPQRPKPWVKPADFRPAEASAVSQAVELATEIAESLKHMIDHLDEVLELVEVAERQKLADEREIEELRRALRRIQPPRREQQPPSPPARGPRRDEPRRDEPNRSHRDQGQRHDEPRREPREQSQRRDEPPVQREPEPPRENPNPEA